MIRSCLVATAMLATMMGITLAQTPKSSTTLPQSTTSGPVQVIDASSDSGTQRVSDRDGVITDKPQTHTSETIVAPTEDKMTTQKASEATTVR
jgi:hypothetical protein